MAWVLDLRQRVTGAATESAGCCAGAALVCHRAGRADASTSSSSGAACLHAAAAARAAQTSACHAAPPSWLSARWFSTWQRGHANEDANAHANAGKGSAGSRVSDAEDEDPWRVLGVPRHATKAEVKAAFTALAKQLHPDSNPRPEAQTQFIRVKHAYDVIRGAAQSPLFHRAASRKDVYAANENPEILRQRAQAFQARQAAEKAAAASFAASMAAENGAECKLAV